MKTILALILLLTAVSCGKSSDNSSKTRLREPVSDSTYFFLLNEYRMKLGLRPLTYSDNIEDLALEHSEWMGQTVVFGHNGWKERCRKLRTDLEAVNCGEIVARGQETAKEVLEAWLSSAPHKKSIENPEWTHTGIGVAIGTDGQTYWTQMFIKIQ
jgi:uncharacterized protein YkwD